MLTTNVKVKNKFLYPFVYEDTFFSHDEIQKIITYCESKDLDQDSTAFLIPIHEQVKNSRYAVIKYDSDNQWFFNKFLSVLNEANKEFFGLNLLGFDHLLYMVNDSNKSEHSYHMDYSLQNSNTDYSHLSVKLSCNLFLSTESEYDGGEFEIIINENHKVKIEQLKGRMVFFPSFMMHKMYPITRGIRKSILIHGLGPSWT